MATPSNRLAAAPLGGAAKPKQSVGEDADKMIDRRKKKLN